MKTIWRLLFSDRNACSVSYSRFGGPGDVLDDRPRPSRIYIAQFDDNDPKFVFFKLCHAQKAAVSVAGFGMSTVILVFISVFFEFDWYSHKTGIDIITLTCLFIYLLMGILIHYDVITGIKKQASHYLLPFIVTYVVTIGVEVLLIFFQVLRLHSPPLDFSFKEKATGIYVFSISALLILVIVQALMLRAVCQCRYYLSCKSAHLTALKVVESSRTKHPGIQVVYVSSSLHGTNSIYNADSRINQVSRGTNEQRTSAQDTINPWPNISNGSLPV
ncbi:unnamed protein product [Thelazia callipaeda]|uniref:MARVEL domain-containing protein n=1 Tax=Thelazia callipaeda TaxID=103827 RepID=A0A0N5CK27_THECL|nr:unnamed protein product [Thelazia callipaeda]